MGSKIHYILVALWKGRGVRNPKSGKIQLAIQKNVQSLNICVIGVQDRLPPGGPPGGEGYLSYTFPVKILVQKCKKVKKNFALRGENVSFCLQRFILSSPCWPFAGREGGGRR